MTLRIWARSVWRNSCPARLQFFVGRHGALPLRRTDSRATRCLRRDRGAAFFTAAGPGGTDSARYSPAGRGAFVFSFALCTPVVRMRSDMSYSVYLVHGPLVQTLILLGVFQDTLGMLAAVVLAVLILAFIGERLVERPGNEFGRRLSSRIAPRAPVMPRVA